MESSFDRTIEDVGNIVHLEHVNVTQPDQRLATLFYVSGLGLTRDPYMMVGVDNMWINIGRTQMHLPTGRPQRVRGTIGLLLPDLDALRNRLRDVAPSLADTQFAFSDRDGAVTVSCPWGNRFYCRPGAPLAPTRLGIAYVEFAVPSGTAGAIARFYQRILHASAAEGIHDGHRMARVSTGGDQYLLFRETAGNIPAYDGHHIQIYIANFSAPYRQLLERSLVTRDHDPHEWRFRDIVDPDTNETVFTVEHEVRSLKHPLYARPLVNRNPAQNNRDYVRGKDALSEGY